MPKVPLTPIFLKIPLELKRKLVTLIDEAEDRESKNISMSSMITSILEDFFEKNPVVSKENPLAFMDEVSNKYDSKQDRDLLRIVKESLKEKK